MPRTASLTRTSMCSPSSLPCQRARWSSGNFAESPVSTLRTVAPWGNGSSRTRRPEPSPPTNFVIHEAISTGTVAAGRVFTLRNLTDWGGGSTPRRGPWLPGGATGARGRLVEELVALGLEPAHELFVGARSDDPVELRAIVRHEAHVLDEDVVDQPPIPAEVHAGFDGHLGPRPRQDARADRGQLPVDRLAEVLDPFAAVLVHPRDVGPLQKIGKELGEFLALGRRTVLPVAGANPRGRPGGGGSPLGGPPGRRGAGVPAPPPGGGGPGGPDRGSA